MEGGRRPQTGLFGRRRDRLDFKDSLQQLIHNLGLALLPSALDLLDLSVGLLVGFLLGLLVALGMLRTERLILVGVLE